MKGAFRLACLMLVLCIGGTAFAQAALAQAGTPPQRPFSQLVSLWTRQLDRIGDRADQTDIQAGEIDALREQTIDVRAAAAAAAALARNDLADTKKLLAPLEPQTGTDQPPDTDAVKAERDRLTEQAAVSESRVKQCEVVIARADQLLDRMTKLRGQVVLQTLLHRGLSPLSPSVWQRIGPEFASAIRMLSGAMASWGREGLSSFQSGDEDLSPLALWALVTIALWWIGRWLRQRFGRGEATEPGQRDRTIAAAIDGVGLVLVPILAVWLIGKLLAASHPPVPIDNLLPELINRVISFLLVVGLTATALTPRRPAWRVLAFTDSSAQHLSTALRRLMAIGLVVDFVFVALTQGSDREAVHAVGALVLATTVALLTLPAMSDRAWQAARAAGSELPPMVGGTWWSVARLVLSAAVLASIIFALLGYATLASHVHSALASTCLLLALALLAHRLCGDLLDAAAAPETTTGRWVRRRLGLPADATLRGQNIVLLLIDFVLVVLLGIGIPAAWSVDIDAILNGFGQLLHGVRIGGVRISLENIGMAILAFGLTMLLLRLVRSIVRDRVMPTVDAPLPLRQTIDAGLNYAGVIIALLIGVTALGIDFTNLAIVLGALSVGIGLGLQNIANNVISGVIMLLERPVKAGDWVSVNGHEGFVRRINIRATEIETFQRTHVIVPNSLFLQNPVINRTYSDTSSRIDLSLTVALATDVTKLETILRETALAHPRVLRVPAPIVRFVRMTTTGLDFELFVFVSQLADRVIVNNDLNRDLLARLVEEKIIDPRPVPELRVRDLDKLAGRLAVEGPSSSADHASSSPSR
ncbi:MAG: mechanosensitive ion channel family protein [Alphaproteobacteria bacterium]|nr:mechanosensitive ion channel family protein [Alphaproteobacteria bacterium]